MRREAGMTLMEVLIAVSLLSVLSLGMMLAMRLGISALWRTDQRLMDNRRVAGAQRIVEQELEGLVPVAAPCHGAGGEGGPKVPVFSGQPTGVTLVSTLSLQQAWRGRPQVLQIFTMPSEEGGVRLVVNEIPYPGPKFVGGLCTGIQQSQEAPGNFGQFIVPKAGEGTFVLADRLQSIAFQYLKRPEKERGEEAGVWLPAWQRPDWPAGIRIVMTPLNPSAARLQPVTVTAPIYIYRNPEVTYVDR
jgi:prepilin-type N-terminal cleavage/methylation domain-containing protein